MGLGEAKTIKSW